MDYFRFVCFGIGVVLLGYGVLRFLRRKINRNEVYVSALIEFLAYYVLVIPNVWSDTPSSGVRVVESFFTTILVSVTKYMGEGYDRFPVESATPEMAVFNGFYNIAIILANILMLAFAADIILHLVNGPYQELKLARRKGGNVYLFSECNEKTLAIAQYTSEEGNTTGKTAVVFAVSEEGLSDSLKAAADRIDAITIPQGIEDIYDRVKAMEIKVFLFNNKEEKNLQQMADISSRKRVDAEVTIYAEVNATPWSLYDDYIKQMTSENDKLTINLVRTEENYIYNMLIRHSIFDNAISEGKDKKINIVILGYNDRNVEFLKAVLHLGQMPGYELSVVLIEEGDHKSQLNLRMPELFSKGGGYGDAIYTFEHITGIEYDSSKLEDIIASDYGDFTFAFVNTEDDIRDISLALRLNSVKYRAGKESGFKIISNVKDKAAYSDKLANNLVKNIVFEGDIKTVYDYRSVTMSKIEECTIKIHEDRYGGSKTWKEYCNNEYNRHSVYARTLSFAYKVKIIDSDPATAGNYDLTNTDLKWKIYEHMRWDMYTRTLGYTKSPSTLIGDDGKVPGSIRKIAKVHNCLIPFDDLTEEEKNKDSLKMTETTVGALKDLMSSSRLRK